MNILTRIVIALTDEEQQTLRDAADILRDIAGALEDRGGNDTGYNIRGMASDLENFVEDNSEIICEEGGGIMVWHFLGGFALCYILSLVVIFLCDPINEEPAIIYMAPILIPCIVVGLPFYVVYRVFFRLTIKVVPVENVKRAAKSDDHYTIRHVFGKIYL